MFASKEIAERHGQSDRSGQLPPALLQEPEGSRCYREFLLRSHDPEEREYPDPTDQIREVLIHGNYLSQKDVDICLGFDLETLANNAEIASIRELHHVLGENFGARDEEVRA